MIAGAGPDQYRKCLEILCDDPDIDAILVIFIPPLLTPSSEVARTIGELLSEHEQKHADLEKTVAAVFLDPHSKVVSIPAGSRRVPVYNFPEGAVSALSAAVRYGTWRNAPLGNRVSIEVNSEDVQKVLSSHPGEGWLRHDAVEKLLNSVGIKINAAQLISSPEDAITFAKTFGRPVAMKVSDPRVLHKSDVGGVLLNIRPDEAGEAYAKLKEQLGKHEIELDAATISPMAQSGVEVLAGVTHDPVFGPLVAFGSGGVLVEILDDIVFRVLPLTDRDVKEMIAGSRVARLLKGYRGMPAADVDALEQLLLRLGALAESVPRIAEIDLNPVIVHAQGEGITIIDARVTIKCLILTDFDILPRHEDARAVPHTRMYYLRACNAGNSCTCKAEDDFEVDQDFEVYQAHKVY